LIELKFLPLVLAIIPVQASSTTVFVTDANVKDLNWRGYNSESRSMSLPCVAGPLQLKLIEQSSFGFLYDESFESIMRENAGKASGSTNGVVLSGSASREFLIRKSQNDWSDVSGLDTLNSELVAQVCTVGSCYPGS
jgi:hypothetical protein